MKIKIAPKIAEKLQIRVEKSGEYKDVEEYVNYLLKQVVDRLVEEENDEDGEQIVKERLKNLGYFN